MSHLAQFRGSDQVVGRTTLKTKSLKLSSDADFTLIGVWHLTQLALVLEEKPSDMLRKSLESFE